LEGRCIELDQVGFNQFQGVAMESIKIWIFVVTIFVLSMSIPLAIGGIFLRYHRQRKMGKELAEQQDLINARLQRIVGVGKN
jgi:hypothetical protein